MKFYRLTSSGEQVANEVEINWEQLPMSEKHAAYHDLRADGGGMRLVFGKDEVQGLKDKQVIGKTVPLLDEAMVREEFEYFCLQSPPKDAERMGNFQPDTPVAMVKFKGERGPKPVNIGGVSTNELGDLLFGQK